MWLLFMTTENGLLYFYDWGVEAPPAVLQGETCRLPLLTLSVDALVTVSSLQAAIRRRRQLEHRGPAHPSQARLPGAVTVRGFPNTLIQVGHTRESGRALSRPKAKRGGGGLLYWCWWWQSSKELVRLYYLCLLKYRKDQQHLVCGVPKHMK